jgi:hypothetical protein
MKPRIPIGPCSKSVLAWDANMKEAYTTGLVVARSVTAAASCYESVLASVAAENGSSATSPATLNLTPSSGVQCLTPHRGSSTQVRKPRLISESEFRMSLPQFAGNGTFSFRN